MSRNRRRKNNYNRPEGLSYRQFAGPGITKASLSGVSENFIAMVDKINRNTNHAIFLNDYDFWLKPEYNATVKVNVADGDVWDELRGQEEARKKVMTKYHRDFDKNMVYLLNELHKFEAGLLHYSKKHYIKLDGVVSPAEYEEKMYSMPDKPEK